jgi:signal transduction histidine kinase
VVAALQASDRLKSSILDSIPSTVAVVDEAGRVVTVNDRWLADAHDNEPPELPRKPGAPYLDAWAAYSKDGPGHARPAYEAIKDVLAGGAGATLEYSSATPDGDRWWMMSVVPLKSVDGGAVISHTDITARKHAEFEAQRAREELAHVTRVWVMGELAAALSHQVNQPLTGIIGNAQAGLRFLTATPPNLPELREILLDINGDAERAADVTRAVRKMLRKDTPGREPLDMNDVVRDTTSLVTSRSRMHKVDIHLELATSLPAVPGDRVQLSQVVLNLLMNAIESLSADDGTKRKVTVRTVHTAANCVHLSVIDTGQGVPEGTEEQVFDPLFTTKADGMGMGLPIARAIVEAHGGIMWAQNEVLGGAAFHMTLPVAATEEDIPPIAATG